MKKIMLLTMVLGLVLCFSLASQAQTSPEWALIKKIALEQGTREGHPKFWAKEWWIGKDGKVVPPQEVINKDKKDKTFLDKGWVCSYYENIKTIFFSKAWRESDIDMIEITTYLEEEDMYQQEIVKNKIPTLRNLTKVEGINLGKQFINELRALGFI